jgi:heme/copper-type cytochrome/quinol oxidase subunit 3
VIGRRSRTVIPITEDGTLHGQAVGMWGMWQAIIVLVVGTGGFATAALYLHSGQPEWPPSGIAAPGVWLAVLSMALAAGAGATMLVARTRQRADAGADTAVALLATMGLLLAAILVLAVDLAAVDFRWDEHAYTSLYWVFYGVVITYHALALLMLGSVLLQRLAGLLDSDRMLELDNTLLMVLFTAAAAVVLLGLVHWLPIVTTADGIGVPQVGPGSEG